MHGCKEDKNEDTDKAALKIFNEEMDLQIDPKDIDRSHRIGKMKNDKSRPIIVKFTSYRNRKKVFSSKRRLKGKNVSITESLSAFRMKKLSEARDNFGFKNVWTYDGKIFYKESSDVTEKPKVFFV